MKIPEHIWHSLTNKKNKKTASQIKIENPGAAAPGNAVWDTEQVSIHSSYTLIEHVLSSLFPLLNMTEEERSNARKEKQVWSHRRHEMIVFLPQCVGRKRRPVHNYLHLGVTTKSSSAHVTALFAPPLEAFWDWEFGIIPEPQRRSGISGLATTIPTMHLTVYLKLSDWPTCSFDRRPEF